MRLNTAVFIFEDMELLDFAGPFEIFSVTDQLNDSSLFNTYTVARDNEVVSTKNRVLIKPHYTLANCPRPDILVVPGGKGARPLLNMPGLLDWVAEKAEEAKLVLSVCTGALVLAKAGVLNGLRATTHHLCFDELEAMGGGIKIYRDARYIDNGRIITSAGVAAGMDMSLYVVAKLHGAKMAQNTADYIEYDWSPDKNQA
jgi:transcriptional regulator GlxA family with amidase domain